MRLVGCFASNYHEGLLCQGCLNLDRPVSCCLLVGAKHPPQHVLILVDKLQLCFIVVMNQLFLSTENQMKTPSVHNTYTLQGALGSSVLHANLPAKEYHSDITVQSCSLLKPMLLSPAHYKSQFLERHTSSVAKDLGTLIHCLVLEPGKFSQEFVVYHGEKDGRVAEFKTFCHQNPNRMVIDDVAFGAARRMSNKILETVVRGRPFGDYVAEGIPEATIYYTDPSTNVRCRTRIDLLHPEITFDLKTTAYPERDAWLRHGLSLNYDMQAYMYSLAVSLFYGEPSPRPFIFVVGESTPPHSVSRFTAGETYIENGGRKYKEALSGFAACSSVNHWPDLGREEVIEVDHWQASRPTSAWREAL
ncbi:MAG: hypothetical protein CVU22_07460 [Betaproteobacteria bacterium HGW-Betaproteobacteria-16]|nr:MAG: hypothetical protein CVU22_07460 [Betaproteobacteria bacterium HGW-Betaproteobacteria-16]